MKNETETIKKKNKPAVKLDYWNCKNNWVRENYEITNRTTQAIMAICANIPRLDEKNKQISNTYTPAFKSRRGMQL